jgi:hypothetical protein
VDAGNLLDVGTEVLDPALDAIDSREEILLAERSAAVLKGKRRCLGVL